MYNILLKTSFLALLCVMSFASFADKGSRSNIQAFEVIGDGRNAVESGKRIVKYYFMLDCPYCMSIEDYLQNWELTIPGDYELRYVPVVNEDRHQYMALFIEGFRRINPSMTNSYIQRLMYQIQIKGRNPNALSLYYSVAQKLGVGKEVLIDSIKNVETLDAVKEIAEEQERYNIVGTPMFIVSDRFKTSLGHVNGNVNILFQVLNGLISEDLRTKGFSL